MESENSNSQEGTNVPNHFQSQLLSGHRAFMIDTTEDNMTRKDKFRKYRQTAMIASVFIGALFLLQPSLPKYLSISFFSIGLVLLVWNSIGTFYYGKAAKALQTRDKAGYEKSMPYFEKALKWGVNEKCQIAAGTLILQRGDMEKGRSVLEDLTECSDPTTRENAKVSLSMYWWMKNNLDKAIELCLDAKEHGCKDKNLYVNLCTYLLEKADYKNYRKYTKECNDNNMATPATLDLECAYYMTQKDWKKAGTMLNPLVEETAPQYKDPYLHDAMIRLHYGDWEGAVKSLSAIATSCTESNTSVFTMEEIDDLITLIKDEDTRWGVLEVVDNNPLLLIRGEIPGIRRGLKKPETPAMPEFVEVISSASSIGTEEDESDLDTDLNDDDEEWIRRHNGN